MIIQRLRHGRARPIPEYVSKSDSVELQVIWNYLGHDPPINCRRTLDQYGYPSLRDTRSRDDDQMLYKLTKERVCFPDQQRDLGTQGSSSRSTDGAGSWRERIAGVVGGDLDDEDIEKDVLNGNVLMVDQLWLWVLNSGKLTSRNLGRKMLTMHRNGFVFLPKAGKRSDRGTALPASRSARQHLQRSQCGPHAPMRKCPGPRSLSCSPRRERPARPVLSPGPRGVSHLRGSH